jgi:3-methyladenine DNA glycosylase/8-oxoguanine DNA glycosylase
LALLSGTPPTDALAHGAGLRDKQALAAALRDALHLAPAELAALGREGRYTLAFGAPSREPFHVEETLRYLARDADNLAERVEGPAYSRYLPLDGRALPVTLTFAARGCTVALPDGLAAGERLALHRMVVRMLGLEQPLAAFYRAVRRDPVMGPLTRALRGVRIPQVPSLWEALCWAIIGQQINLAFAYRLRNRMIALGNGIGDGPGDGPGDGLNNHAAAPPRPPYPFPAPEQVLAIPASAWREAQFSRQKAAYLQGLARAFTEGALREEPLRRADPEAAHAALLAVRGLGPWSAAYGCLRGLGQMDALPVGDAGLRVALRHHFALATSPDTRTQEALMEPFRPYRGLATYYLWKSLAQVRQE